MFQKLLAVLMVTAMSTVAFAQEAVPHDKADENGTHEKSREAVKKEAAVKEEARRANEADVNKARAMYDVNAKHSQQGSALDNSGAASRMGRVSTGGDLDSQFSAIGKPGAHKYDLLTPAEKAKVSVVTGIKKWFVRRGVTVALAAAAATAVVTVPHAAYADVSLVSESVAQRVGQIGDTNPTLMAEMVQANAEIANETGKSLIDGMAGAESCLGMGKVAVENLANAVKADRAVVKKGPDAMFDAFADSLDATTGRSHEDDMIAVCNLTHTAAGSQIKKGMTEGSLKCNIVIGEQLNAAERCKKL